MSLNFSKISLLVALAVSLSFCNSEEATRKRTVPEGNTTVKQDGGRGVVPFNLEEASRLERLLKQAEPVVVEQLKKDKASIDTVMLDEKVIKPLQDVVLNTNYMLNPDNRYLETASGIQLIPRLVVLFDQAVILMYNANPRHAQLRSILPQMKSQILWDCDQDLPGSCSFIRFYSRVDSNNIVRIVRIFHDQESNEAEKVRLVKAAFDLANRRLDENLRFMLLERLAVSLSQEREGTISQQRLSLDANLFANVLKINMAENSANTSERYIALIRATNPWLLSRNDDSPKSPAMTELLALAAQNLIYEKPVGSLLPAEVMPAGSAGMPAVSQRRLSPELQLAVQGLYYKVGPDNEQGVSFQKENLLGDWKTRFQNVDGSWKPAEEIARLSDTQRQVYENIQSLNGEHVEFFGQESKAILRSMGVDKPFAGDEYFFLVHQIYYEHYNIDDAAAFWQGTSKDQVRLMEAIMELIKLQIVNNIVLTNTRMNRFYGESNDTKIIELMNEAQKEAAEVRKVWSKTITRAQTLKSFASRVTDQNIPSHKVMVDNITHSVEALGKNIKFLVTYPSMYSLVHIFASQEMKDKIRTFFGDFEIDSLTVINIFFNGGFAPLFNFGHDGNKLDATEVMYTFYYALVTEIFSTYSTNKNPLLKFSIEDFFRLVVKRLVLSTESSLETAINNLRRQRNDYANIIDRMQQMCREERAAQQREAQIIKEKRQNLGKKFRWQDELIASMVPRSKVDNKIPFMEMASGIYDPTSTREAKVGRHLRNVYSTSANDVLKKLKSDFQQKNIMANILLEIYRQYSKEMGGADHIAGIIQEQFQDFKRLKAEYANLFFSMHEEINGCELDFSKRDRDLRHAILFREAKYWGDMFDDVYNAITSNLRKQREQERPLLTDRDLDPTHDKEVAELHNMASTTDFKNELNIVRDRYMVASTNAMFPQTYRDRKGYTQLDINRVTTFKLDVFARLAYYLTEMFPNQYQIFPVSNFLTNDIYKEDGDLSVNFNWAGVMTWDEAQKSKAREEFVASGVKAFAGFVPWAKVPVDISIADTKGNILVSLYKLNKVAITEGVDCESMSLKNKNFATYCRKVSAKEVIDHYEEYIDLVNIDERDEIILGYLGDETKYSEMDYEKLIKKQKEHKLYSYYDLIYRRIFSDEPVDKPESTWFAPLLVGYVESYQKRTSSTFIFSFPPQLEDIFVENYRPWLDGYFELDKEFLEEVKSRQVTPFKFKYRLDREFLVADPATATTTNPRSYLISPLIYGKFTGFIQTLNKNTNYHFRDTIGSRQAELEGVLNAPEEN